MDKQFKPDRINIIDALRGFALAGILIVHMLEQYIAAPRPDSTWEIQKTLVDQIIMGFGFVFLTGKFFSIFSLLFGISFAIMMERAKQRGEKFAGRFIWRLCLLLAIGLLHSLLYRGDILSTYALIGLLLPLLYGLTDRWLWLLAAGLFFGMGRYLFYIITGNTTLLSYELSPTSDTIIQYVELLKTGTLTAILNENLSNGFASKYDFQFSIFGRGYLTLGYFLIGAWLVRAGIIQNIEIYRVQIKQTLLWSLCAAGVSVALLVALFSQIPQPINMASWPFLIGMTLYDLSSIAFTTTIITSFLLLYIRKPSGLLSTFCPYGRMALSQYLFQSILGTWLFYGWGLGLLGKLHDWQTLLIALVLIYSQMQFSHFWLNRYRYGPVEWAWRCGTYWQYLPNRKAIQIA